MRKRTAWLSYPRSEPLTFQEYIERLEHGELEPGLSPGGAAQYLGIQRASLPRYAERGTIGAYVVLDDANEVVLIDIPISELRNVKKRRRPRHQQTSPSRAPAA